MSSRAWGELHPPYRVIVADPPWPILPAVMGAGGRRARPTSRPYSLMSLAELAGLAVGPELAADTAVLGLWVPAGLNRVGVGVELAEAWGFAVVGEMIWAKPNLGMGAVPRTSHEVLLIATRGAGALAGAPRGIHSVQTWGQTYGRGKAHSRKPSGALDLAERLSPGPYLELFARQGRLGWDTWGYGVEARHPVPDTGGINRGGSPGQGTNPGG